MPTVDRFAYTIPQIEALEPRVQAALAPHLAADDPVRQIIYSPALYNLPRGRKFGPEARIPPGEPPASVLVLTGERLLAVTLLKPPAEPPVAVTPLADLLRVELGQILLFSWLEWSWADAGQLAVYCVFFNTVGETLFWGLATAMRQGVSAGADLPAQTGRPKEDAFLDLPYKFENLVPNKLMLPDERVQAVVFQPAIWQRRWLVFKRRRGPAVTVVLSPEHLLLAHEDSPPAGAAYGMIARYCPRTRLAALTVESEGEDHWLAVTLRWRGVEESWRTLFQPAAEPALRALEEQAGL